MELIVTINLDNAVFEEEGSKEIARILRKLAMSCEMLHVTSDLDVTLHDLNGNTVGSAVVDND